MAQDVAIQSPLEARLRALWDMSGRDIGVQAWRWPKEERVMLAREFKAYLEGGKFGKPVGHQPISILIELGDRDVTLSEVKKMAANPFGQNPGFDSSGSPVAIEYLAPYVFSQEPDANIGTGDVQWSPFSFHVTQTIFAILSDCSAFDGEVTSWARKVIVPDPVSQRAELQRWWKENKIHFEQEDYKAVKAGRPIRSQMEALDETLRNAGLPLLEKRRQEQPASEPLSSEPKPASAPIAQIPTPAVESKTSGWPWLVGIVALALIAWLVLKRRA